MPTPPLVLVAEGHDDTRLLLTTLLRLSGFSVVESGNGLEAVRLAQEREPVVVVLDSRLDAAGGPPIACQLRASPGRPAIVAISTGCDPAELRRARADDCEAYLEKPLNIDQLVDVVRSLAGGRQPGGPTTGAGPAPEGAIH